MANNVVDQCTVSDEVGLPGLSGKRIAITAGGSGIGLSIARLLHSHGALIAICDVDEIALQNASDALPDTIACIADVSEEHQVQMFFAQIKKKWGGLDALVNNAGIAGPTARVEDLSLADWNRCINVTLTGQFLSTRSAVPLLKASGGGAVINIASAAAKHGYAYRTPYSSAKFGVIGLTQSLAKELGPKNITVNAILPGIVEGPRMEGVINSRAMTVGVTPNEMRQQYLGNISLRRMVTHEDIAGSVAFLISSLGKNISGQSLAVDGNVENL